MTEAETEISNIIGRIENIDISTTFKSDIHSGTLLTKMNDLRQSDHDVEIVASEKIIKAHKLVLKSASNYFSAMLRILNSRNILVKSRSVK